MWRLFYPYSSVSGIFTFHLMWSRGLFTGFSKTVVRKMEVPLMVYDYLQASIELQIESFKDIKTCFQGHRNTIFFKHKTQYHTGCT